jgi:hypothetical protein
MYDERFQFEKYFFKTFRLHSISNENEFMIYLNLNNSKNFDLSSKKLKITVNTGLFGKNKKISKSLYERELWVALNNSILKHFFIDPKAAKILNIYIIIIKSSKDMKLKCLKGVFFGLREIFGKNIKILTYKSLFSGNPKINLFEVNFSKKKFLCFFWNLSILIDVFNSDIFSMFTEGLISFDFLIINIFYIGHVKWILNLKQ